MANKVGRKPSIDESTLKQLEGAFANGATDVEACFLAKISHQTLYNYQKEYPEFIERKEGLKNMIKYIAKQKVKQTIETELGCDTSKWYLERKGKDEGFSNRTEHTGADGKDLNITVINYGDNNDSLQLPTENISTTVIESD